MLPWPWGHCSIATSDDISQIIFFFRLFYGLLGGFTGLLLTIWRPRQVLFCALFGGQWAR
jgi:hypothetical protein